jgi:soluble lytic murein transglycosylase-like protein
VRRFVTLGLVGIGLLGISCQMSGPVLVEEAPEPLVHFSHGAAMDAALADLEQAADASMEAQLLAELRECHTGLADHELVVLAATIVEQGRVHNVDPGLVMAVIHVESRGYHRAVSPVGALGLMQLLPATAEELARNFDLDWHGPQSLFDPVLNVKLGTAYLSQLTPRFDSTNTALAAYNWGPSRIVRRIRRGAGVPTRYVELVMKAYDEQDKLQARRS